MCILAPHILIAAACVQAPKSREEIFAVRLRAQMEKQTRMLVQMRKVVSQPTSA